MVKFHAANGKAQYAFKSAFIFFLLSFGVGGGDFFFFPLFPTYSLQVPNGFSSCSQYVPQVPQGCSQQHLAVIPYVLPKVLPFSPIQVGQRQNPTIFPQNLLHWEVYRYSTIFCDGPIKQSHYKKKERVGLVRHLQLI